MFAILSRQSSRARNVYVCSSCLGHVDPTLVLPSRFLGPTNASYATTINSANFSTTARLQEERTGPEEGKNVNSSAEAGNGVETPRLKSPRQLRRKRAQERIARQKEDTNVSKVAAVVKKSSRTRSDIAPKVGNLSNSAEALDALRKSMLSEDQEVEKTSSKTKTTSRGSGTKKEKPDPVIAKTRISSGGVIKVGKGVKPGTTDEFGEDGVVKEKKTAPAKPAKPAKKKITKNVESGKASSEKPVNIQKIYSKAPESASDDQQTHLEYDPDSHVRKVHRPGRTSPGVQSTVAATRSPWAKKWIDAIASDRDGGSGFKRAILLKLIEKGNLSPKDVGPAVTLLRNAIQEDQEQRASALREVPSKANGFRSIRQAMQGDSTRELPSSQKRITRQPSKGKSMGPSRSDKLSKEENAQDTNTPLRGTIKHEIESINASDLTLVPLDVGPLEVPKLSYGLERVLFNPGVYQLQDPRSRVFNFDPYLQTIMPVSEFDFSALKEYITSSRDTTLLNIARAEKRKYTGSTSSMTSALGHFHFLLSQWRPINAGMVSKEFPAEFSSFTALQRGPTAIFLRYKDGVYAIDADKEFDTANILSSLGKSMEKLLTLPTEDFEKYRKPNSDQITQEERDADEAFHYTTMGDFLMRSQLDAYDPRLPGTGMFDLKTRAVVSIRMDTSKYEEGSGYEIKQRHGEWESFEREYYDMIRAAFLKYSLQVRMGRMDGIFVAFHNTERIFGFQYISLPEMDMALHGTDDTTIGDSEFKLSLDLLNRVLDRATARFPEKSIRLFFETREGSAPFMYIFAEPVEEREIDKIQTSNKAEIDEFESRVLGLEKEATEEEIRQAEWDSLYSKVEETMDKDESGLAADEEDAVDDQSADSGVWDAEEIRKVEDFIKTAAQEDGTPDEEDEDDEDHGLEEADEEEGGENDEVVEEHDEDDVEDHEEGEGEDLEESDEHDSSVDEQVKNPSLSESHTEEEPLGINFEEDKEESVQDNEFVPDEQESQLEETSEETSGESLEANQEGLVKETSIDSESNANLEDHSDQPAVEESEDSAQSVDSEGSTDSSENDLFSISSSKSTETATSDLPPIEEVDDNMLAMTLTIRNKINGQYTKRPSNLNSSDKWTLEYSLAEVKDPERARKLYKMAKERRSKTLKKTKKNNTWNENYVGSLMSLARKGREYRKNLDEKEKGRKKEVLDLRDVSKAGK